MSRDGLPVVDKNKCKACNKCVEICPKKLFTLIPVTHNVYPAPAHRGGVYVACSSHDLGKDTKAVCPVGCIACKLCEKACKFSAINIGGSATVCGGDAIHVIDNLAIIDYNKCTSCGECVKVCPMKTIRLR
jgi:NAD-dependent dihydropyrimidine dehydrogenase PreA subunit